MVLLLAPPLQPASAITGLNVQSIIGSFVVSETFLTAALNLSASSEVHLTAIMSSFRLLPMYSKLKLSACCTLAYEFLLWHFVGYVDSYGRGIFVGEFVAVHD